MNATGLSAAGGVGKVIAEWIANVDHCRITSHPSGQWLSLSLFAPTYSSVVWRLCPLILLPQLFTPHLVHRLTWPRVIVFVTVNSTRKLSHTSLRARAVLPNNTIPRVNAERSILQHNDMWSQDVRRFADLHNNREFLRSRVKETTGAVTNCAGPDIEYKCVVHVLMLSYHLSMSGSYYVL